jgi:hypothetical protein
MGLWREPLLHFLVLGALIFGLYGWVGGASTAANAPHRIVVAAPTLGALSKDWQRQWGRSPTAAELQTLVDQYVHDEVFYQEALALGLAQNDLIVRQRLIQKMEFLAEDLSALREPTDEVLQAYLDDHGDRYTVPGRVSFSQVYFSQSLRGVGTEAEARALLGELRVNPRLGQSQTLGDRSMLPASFTLASAQAIASVFGEPFAKALTGLTETGWQGPFPSAYGTHLVNVAQLEPGHPATLDEVRGDVRLDWLRDQRQQQDERFYAELRHRYTVTVDRQAWPTALQGDSP